MKQITHERINDKIGVFEVAGLDTKGFDYAIPQPWMDQLSYIQRAAQLPDSFSHSFVTDNSALFPKLRSTEEALRQILENRSKANGELMMQLFENVVTKGCHPHDQMAYDIIHDSPDSVISNEADAGFVDLNMILGVIAKAFKAGQESVKKDEPPACGDDQIADTKVLLSLIGTRSWNG